MDLSEILARAMLTGVAFVFLWVVVWGVAVPEVLNLTWSGHENLIMPVLVVGLLGSAARDLRH